MSTPPPPGGSTAHPGALPAPPPHGAGGGRNERRRKRKGRPPYGAIVVGVVVFGLVREVAQRLAADGFGAWGILVVALGLFALVTAWRLVQRRRVARAGGEPFTPDDVRRQVLDADVGGPAFEEDGTLLGASVLAVNQDPKVVELVTTYGVYGADGTRLGEVAQVGQSKRRRAFRLFTGFDQYLTHTFEVRDTAGQVLLHLVRPRKLFYSSLVVTAADGSLCGEIHQRNVFGHIGFDIVAADGRKVGDLNARNWRAWDFGVLGPDGREVATVVKSWEGWAHSALTRADRYVVRIHVPLQTPARELVVAGCLVVDLALKQDTRGVAG